MIFHMVFCQIYRSAPALVYDKNDISELPGQYLVVFEKDATESQVLNLLQCRFPTAESNILMIKVYEVLQEVSSSSNHSVEDYKMAMLGFACNLTTTQVRQG